MRLFGDPSDSQIDEDDRAGICTPPFDLEFASATAEAPIGSQTLWDGRRWVGIELQCTGRKPVAPFKMNRVNCVVAAEYLRVDTDDLVVFRDWVGTLSPSTSATINLNNWTNLFEVSSAFVLGVHGLLVFNRTTPGTPDISFGPLAPNEYADFMNSNTARIVIPALGFTWVHGSFLGTTGTRKSVQVTNLSGSASADYAVIAYGISPLGS